MVGEGELGQAPGPKKEWEYDNVAFMNKQDWDKYRGRTGVGYVSSESIAYSVGGGRGGGGGGGGGGHALEPLKKI